MVPGLKVFPEHGSFGAKTRTVLGKLRHVAHPMVEWILKCLAQCLANSKEVATTPADLPCTSISLSVHGRY